MRVWFLVGKSFDVSLWDREGDRKINLRIRAQVRHTAMLILWI